MTILNITAHIFKSKHFLYLGWYSEMPHHINIKFCVLGTLFVVSLVRFRNQRSLLKQKILKVHIFNFSKIHDYVLQLTKGQITLYTSKQYLYYVTHDDVMYNLKYVFEQYFFCIFPALYSNFLLS